MHFENSLIAPRSIFPWIIIHFPLFQSEQILNLCCGNEEQESGGNGHDFFLWQMRVGKVRAKCHFEESMLPGAIFQRACLINRYGCRPAFLRLFPSGSNNTKKCDLELAKVFSSLAFACPQIRCRLRCFPRRSRSNHSMPLVSGFEWRNSQG